MKALILGDKVRKATDGGPPLLVKELQTKV